MGQIDLGRVIGPQGPQGEIGPVGAQGIQGEPGAPAVVNGYNIVTIEAGDHVSLEQKESTLKISVDASDKQDKLTGTQGQVVGFDADGNAAPENIDGRYQPIVVERITLGTTTEEEFEEKFQEIYDAMAPNSVVCRFINASFTSSKNAIAGGTICVLFLKHSGSYGVAIAMRYSGGSSDYPTLRVRTYRSNGWGNWVNNWNSATASTLQLRADVDFIAAMQGVEL